MNELLYLILTMTVWNMLSIILFVVIMTTSITAGVLAVYAFYNWLTRKR